MTQFSVSGISLDLFRLDYNSISCPPQVSSGSIIEFSDVNSVLHMDHNRYLFLRDESIIVARRMLHLFGKSLGMKRGALFVDGCIAEIFNACKNISPTGRTHINWLDQWAGYLVVANEVRCLNDPVLCTFQCVKYCIAS